jgi:2-oxoglutarate dehydrogenase E1 component
LVVFTPKSLLRHPEVASPFESFTTAEFQPVLADAEADRAPDAVRRALICSGKIYYDLNQARKARPEAAQTALLRCEQLYPFPAAELAAILRRFPKLEQIRWVQEEPENMGAWTFVDRRIEKVLSRLDIRVRRPGYVGRDAAASPATGLAKTHMSQQARVVATALGID